MLGAAHVAALLKLADDPVRLAERDVEPSGNAGRRDAGKVLDELERVALVGRR